MSVRLTVTSLCRICAASISTIQAAVCLYVSTHVTVFASQLVHVLRFDSKSLLCHSTEPQVTPVTFLPTYVERLRATESHVTSVTLRVPGGICHKLSSLRDDSSAGSQSLMALKGCPGKGKSAVGLPCPAGLGVCAWGGCTGSRHLQLGHLHICMCHDRSREMLMLTKM